MKNMKKLFMATLLLCLMTANMLIGTVSAKEAEKKDPAAGKAPVVETELKDTANSQKLADQVEKYIGAKGNLVSAKYNSDSYYLSGERPRDNETLKRGDKLYVSFYVRDTWRSYYTVPIVSVFNGSGKCIYANYNNEIVSLSGRDHYSGYIGWNSNVTPGSYYVFIVAAPCYRSGTLVSNWSSFDCPVIKTYFKVTSSSSTVSKPSPTYFTSLNPNSRGKCVVKWKSVSGIKGYQIQWSTKKSFSSYNETKVAAGKTKTTIKNLKYDKKYYIRIRTYKTSGGKTYRSAWKSSNFWSY